MPLTADRPKALVEVGGQALLERLLNELGAAGVRDIRVVTGHFAERVAKHPSLNRPGQSVQVVHNQAFSRANNIVSFLVGTSGLDSGCILLNSDIIVDGSVIGELARTTGNVLAVDRDEPLGAEEMKVQLDTNGHLTRISKELIPGQSAGEFIGALRLDVRGLAEVRRAAERLVGSGGTNLYYEHAIDNCAPDLRAEILPMAGRAWTEIDDHVDLARAELVARGLDGPK